ncbi:carbonyl reductase [NADPH] 1-like [Macrosteles quadrilineatus]|uniref:carbonyl reductase [NADPH] 1-like n=1 Tax=Macrosteles quadrilineatus TaxID=74068 RepID=UPI0023E18C2B|nr:carbonyl reductase [NADPH] 1-like [Macrosteles quadrilineatus]
MESVKTAVVTGSNKGIGYAILKGLCEKFPGVVYLTARDVNRGQEAVAKLNKLGFKPEFHQLDITDKKSISTFAEFMKKKHGGIDVLVNNAAIAYKNNATEPFSEQAEVTVKVNYFALLDVCEALFPLLRPNARVVNLSSSCGHLSKIPSETLRKRFSDPNLTVDQLNVLMKEFVKSAAAGTNEDDGWGCSAYNVSKVGVSALTIIQQRQFDADSRPGIVVNSVHPGYVDTDMTSHKGPLTIEQGADAPLYLALLPVSPDVPKGQYVWCDRKVTKWTGN